VAEIPRLTREERKVLLSVPSLFPDGDSDELKLPGVSREAISNAIQHLIGLGLVRASSYQGSDPFAPYYRDVELTTEGEQLRRNLARWRLVQWFGREWKWVLSSLIGLCLLAIALWKLLHGK
jgi:hypothetical protein